MTFQDSPTGQNGEGRENNKELRDVTTFHPQVKARGCRESEFGPRDARWVEAIP